MRCKRARARESTRVVRGHWRDLISGNCGIVGRKVAILTDTYQKPLHPSVRELTARFHRSVIALMYPLENAKSQKKYSRSVEFLVCTVGCWQSRSSAPLPLTAIYFLNRASSAASVSPDDLVVAAFPTRGVKYSQRLARSLSRTHSADDSRHPWCADSSNISQFRQTWASLLQL